MSVSLGLHKGAKETRSIHVHGPREVHNDRRNDCNVCPLDHFRALVVSKLYIYARRALLPMPWNSRPRTAEHLR